LHKIRVAGAADGLSSANPKPEGTTAVTPTLYDSRSPARAPLAPDLFGALTTALETARTWRARARSRRVLLTLDERMLRDIGITRYDARIEARKPFWRA
jgi:uncharacterized protein YjiS (DUF1127 family)